MVFAPGHYQEITQPRPRRRLERIAIRLIALTIVILLGLVVFSLTTHQKQSGNGCVDFNYTTMIGGAEMYKCGGAAKTLCATPRGSRASIDSDFETALYPACRKAGIPTPAA
ncbi:MAG TPA: hypothetical protein VMV16_03650 [Solirubrobacteraceae bacterium]|nr:hypothetical protein [Solirubrobacteraceae bacterium]